MSRPSLTPEAVAAMLEEYKAGARPKDLAVRYKCSTKTIGLHVRSAGLPTYYELYRQRKTAAEAKKYELTGGDWVRFGLVQRYVYHEEAS